MSSETTPIPNPIVDRYRLMLLERLITRISPTPTHQSRDEAEAALNAIETFLGQVRGDQVETRNKVLGISILILAADIFQLLEGLFDGVSPTPTPPTRSAAVVGALKAIETFLNEVLDVLPDRLPNVLDDRIMHPATETVHLLGRLIEDLTPTPTPPTREGAVAVLKSVATFLGDLLNERGKSASTDLDIRVIHPATEIIQHLAEALADLPRGAVDDMLAPQTVKHRPPMNATERQDRATVTAAYKARRLTKKNSEGTDAREVARAFNRTVKDEGRQRAEEFSTEQIINLSKKSGSYE